MPQKFLCDLCGKKFKQKIDYDRHKNKKSPCISVEEIEKRARDKDVSNSSMSSLSTVFKYCLNVLRDSEHLTGDKALRNLAYLLTLRTIECKIGKGKDIDFDNYEYPCDDDIDDDERQRLLDCAKFSNLSKMKEDNLTHNIKLLWDEILSEHPKTKDIFLKGKGFDIRSQSTYRKLIKKLSDFNFEGIEEDIQGEAYEEVIKDVMTGKVLGQYFTPPKIKQMMVKLINPKVKDDGTIETIFDPAMGTGGFLITSLRHIIKQGSLDNISLDWDFISTKGLGGREAEPDTFQLAKTNMLISSGHMFDMLEKDDSIRNPITNKYDIILANPPFGIKGLLYDEIYHELRNEYMPIKSNKSVPLFLQAIIYMLNINGRCAVVLPDGQELFSKNSSLVSVREYLMKTCNLKEVISLPSGVFTHTSIKTCVFYFVKKRNGEDVLTVGTTKKERKYSFCNDHKTKKVMFYDYNPENDVKNLLVEARIDAIADKNYSLNYAEYLEDVEDDVVHNDNVVIRTLGEICEFKPKSKRKASYGKKQGPYPFYTSSQICSKYCDECDYKTECLIIGTGGDANVKYGTNFSCSTDNFVIKIADHINAKYIYYYLLNNTDLLQKGFVGVGLKHISKEYVKNIKIPIPPLDQQNVIIEQLDYTYETCIKTSEEKIEQLKRLNDMCIKNMTNGCEIKMLGDVCRVAQGEYIKKGSKISGEYPIYGGGDACGYINKYNRENEIIVAKDGVSKNCVRYVKNKFFLNHHGWTLCCEDVIMKKFAYYYLLINRDKLYSIAKGTAQLGINQNNFYSLHICIPPLDQQQKIINYCEYNDTIILQLQDEMENSKQLAKYIIDNATTQPQNIEESQEKQQEISETTEEGTEISNNSYSTEKSRPPKKKEKRKKENTINKLGEKEEIKILLYCKYPTKYDKEQICKELNISEKRFNKTLQDYKYLIKGDEVSKDCSKMTQSVYEKYYDMKRKDIEKYL